MRPQFLARIAAAIAACACINAAAQAPYPNRTVTLIVPYSPGGLPDTVARFEKAVRVANARAD